ncbi:MULTISPECIES: septation protein SepH [unclassified Nocardioides]|uniref:septation protein SepH n=1 Tax=unclassified Nocardioides TaxID=2615069 RepID=UPI00360FBAF3
MSYLRFTGVSEDGTRLRLVDEEGAEHELAVDDRLRAAVAATTTAATPAPPARGMEKTMESMLRPRDIQARIRAGETPEAVAQAAQTSVEKIMAFAAPVLAEREHVAQRAQRSSVRRSDGAAPAGARTLGDAVATHLRSRNVDPETVSWDAWRREDGRWTLTGDYSTTDRSGSASFTFDAPGNYVTLDDEDARWLVGEVITPATPARPDDLQAARERRLTAVEDQLPLGDDSDQLGIDAIDLVAEQPVEAFLDDAPPSDPEVAEEEAEVREEAADAAAAEPEPEEPPARRPVSKKRGRASVPSWDEIMFGGGDRG